MNLNLLDFKSVSYYEGYEEGGGKATLTNINEMLTAQDYPFIHQPKSRYTTCSDVLFQKLWDQYRLNELINKPVHLQFSAQIEHYKLYEVFQHHFTTNSEMNIHDYSIHNFKALCSEEGMPFSDIIWKGELLYFIWEVKEPVVFKSSFQLFAVFLSFLRMIDQIGIDNLVFSQKYTEIKAQQFSNVTWSPNQYHQYNHPYKHRKQQLSESEFNYVDTDGSILQYRD